MKEYNEYGVETPEFREAVSPILDPMRDKIVALMDAGYSAAAIHYSLSSNIQLILSSENIRRALEKRRKLKNGEDS